MTATQTKISDAELAKSIRGGDRWSVVVLCNRIKPKTLTELQQRVYGRRRMSRAAFDRLADAFDVYAPDTYKQEIDDAPGTAPTATR